MYRYLLSALIPVLTACEFPTSAPGDKLPGQIQVWQKDSTYWSWDGVEPVLLLGAGLPENAFLSTGWEYQLKILQESGGNFAALKLRSGDLKEKSYRDSLTAFIEAAARERIAIAVQIDSSGQLTEDRPVLFRKFPNIIPPKYRSFRPRERGALHWSEVLNLREFAGSESIPLLIPEVINHGERAAEGIAAFNRSVLAGAAAVRHAPLPEGEGFTGPALASIRAVRTVERLLKFWELRPAPEVIPNAAPNSVYAATDDKDGFLLYLPTAGSVELQLNIQPQVPLRVTVIGYLGTQKSEILQPPYNDSFTLYTEEPRGGWMVIKPLQGAAAGAVKGDTE